MILNPLTLIFLVLLTVYGKTNFVKEFFLPVLFATGTPIRMIWTIYKKSKLSYKRDRPFSTRPDNKDYLQKSKLSLIYHPFCTRPDDIEYLLNRVPFHKRPTNPDNLDFSKTRKTVLHWIRLRICKKMSIRPFRSSAIWQSTAKYCS